MKMLYFNLICSLRFLNSFSSLQIETLNVREGLVGTIKSF